MTIDPKTQTFRVKVGFPGVSAGGVAHFDDSCKDLPWSFPAFPGAESGTCCSFIGCLNAVADGCLEIIPLVNPPPATTGPHRDLDCHRGNCMSDCPYDCSDCPYDCSGCPKLGQQSEALSPCLNCIDLEAQLFDARDKLIDANDVAIEANKKLAIQFYITDKWRRIAERLQSALNKVWATVRQSNANKEGE